MNSLAFLSHPYIHFKVFGEWGVFCGGIEKFYLHFCINKKKRKKRGREKVERERRDAML